MSAARIFTLDWLEKKYHARIQPFSQRFRAAAICAFCPNTAAVPSVVYRRPILAPHREWVLEQVRTGPNVSLAILQDLLAEHGVTVSRATVLRFLRGCGFGF